MPAELLKASLNLIIALASLGFTWLIGHRLTAYWAHRQKRNELALMAMDRFYAHYGEFCGENVVENVHFTEMRTSKKSFYGTLSQMRCARNATHNNGFKY